MALFTIHQLSLICLFERVTLFYAHTINNESTKRTSFISAIFWGLQSGAFSRWSSSHHTPLLSRSRCFSIMAPLCPIQCVGILVFEGWTFSQELAIYSNIHYWHSNIAFNYFVDIHNSCNECANWSSQFDHWAMWVNPRKRLSQLKRFHITIICRWRQFVQIRRSLPRNREKACIHHSPNFQYTSSYLRCGICFNSYATRVVHRFRLSQTRALATTN